MPAIYQLLWAAVAHADGDFREISIIATDSLSSDVTASSDTASCKHY